MCCENCSSDAVRKGTLVDQSALIAFKVIYCPDCGIVEWDHEEAQTKIAWLDTFAREVKERQAQAAGE